MAGFEQPRPRGVNTALGVFSGHAQRRDDDPLKESVAERFAHRDMRSACGFDEAKARIEPAGGSVARQHREIELARTLVLRSARDGPDQIGPDASAARGWQQHDVDDMPAISTYLKHQPPDRLVPVQNDQREGFGGICAA
jgi:hypothetical protein